MNAWGIATWLLSGGLAFQSKPPADTLTSLREVTGLRVIQQINHANDVVAVSLYLLGGTRQLTERTAGIEALLLTAAKQGGSARYPGETSERAMARTGSVEILQPEADWTVVGFRGLRQDLDSAWRVFTDRLTHPTLDDGGVQAARDRMLASARRRYVDPDERIRLIANRAAFAGHPYAIDPLGTEASLEGLGARDLTEYAQTQLVTSRMLLVVVGNVTPEHLDSLVATTLGTLPRGDYRWTLPPPVPRLTASRWLVESRVLPTNYILGYFPGPPASSEDYVPFRVATLLLSSKVATSTRLKLGLSYAAGAPFLDRAVAVGGMYASTPRPDIVVETMRIAVLQLEGNEISWSGLRDFENYYRIDDLQRRETSAERADFLARAELYQGDYRLADSYFSQLEHVRPGDIMRVVDRYIQLRYMQWAYVGDTVRMSGHW